MIKNRSLASRTFLLSFVPMCLTLAASFFATNAVVRKKIEDGLKQSFQKTETALESVNADHDRRTGQLIAVLSESAGLKAGIGLLREIPQNDKARPQITTTIEEQLRDLQAVLQYDFLAIEDPSGEPVAAVIEGQAGTSKLASLPISGSASRLIQLDGALYETTTVPINLETENVGSLIVGRKFDVKSINPLGHAALLYRGKLVASTFPASSGASLERQLQIACRDWKAGCEIKNAGEEFLVLGMNRAHLGAGYQLVSFQSLDAAMRAFTRGFNVVFLLIGTCGIMAGLALSAIVSRSVSKPLMNLIAHLKESQQAGRLRSNFPVNSATREVNLLAESFNGAARAIGESQQRLDRAYLEFIETMANALDARDPYTAGHSQRVGVLSRAIASAMHLPPKEIDQIQTGAELHDIGKIGVPDAVLQKPGRLTDEEFGLIQLHPQIGKRILQRVKGFEDYLPIVELHHEDHDGRGYPYALKGDEIPIGARIVHVADAYDAMISDRAYRKAMPRERVLEILRSCSGTQFDPRVVEAFFLTQERVAVPKEMHVASV